MAYATRSWDIRPFHIKEFQENQPEIYSLHNYLNAIEIIPFEGCGSRLKQKEGTAGMYPNDSMRQVNAARLRGVSPAASAELISRGRLKTYEIDGVPYVSRRESLQLDSARMSVAPKCDSTLELLQLALIGLDRVHRTGFQIRKAGVILNDLELADNAPRRLWDGAVYEIHKRLMAAVDALNVKFGKDTISCGLLRNSGAWKTRFERRSPAYTTDWRQLMTAQ